MSYQEKRSIVYLISTFFIVTGYVIYMLSNYQSEIFNWTDNFRFWAAAILILIPAQIVPKIVIHILFNIINKIATNEDEPSFTDELDKLIELKSMRNVSFTLLAGFIISMGTQIFNMSPAIMFKGLACTFLLVGVVCDGSHLYYYRKGV